MSLESSKVRRKPVRQPPKKGVNWSLETEEVVLNPLCHELGVIDPLEQRSLSCLFANFRSSSAYDVLFLPLKAPQPLHNASNALVQGGYVSSFLIRTDKIIPHIKVFSPPREKSIHELEQDLRIQIRAWVPWFFERCEEAKKKDGEVVILTGDFGECFEMCELQLLGLAVKYAGLEGLHVTIVPDPPVS